MTEPPTFGRRSSPETQQAWDQYRGQMKAIGKSLSLKQWIIGLLGLYVGIHMLVQSNSAGTKPAVAPIAPLAVGQTANLAKPGCGVTLKEYEAVATGMTRGQVADIYGCAGTEISRVSAGGVESIMVSWPAGGGFGSTDATFDNDRLIGKAQLGLE